MDHIKYPILLVSLWAAFLFSACHAGHSGPETSGRDSVYTAEYIQKIAFGEPEKALAIGFTKEMVESLLIKKEAIRCNGRIYSEEHRRKFDIKNDIFKVENSPTDSNKLVLTINKQPIGEWFKEQFGQVRAWFPENA